MSYSKFSGEFFLLNYDISISSFLDTYTWLKIEEELIVEAV